MNKILKMKTGVAVIISPDLESSCGSIIRSFYFDENNDFSSLRGALLWLYENNINIGKLNINKENEVDPESLDNDKLLELIQRNRRDDFDIVENES